MLEVGNICFGYSSHNNLLDGLSFTVGKGDAVCLLGPNGAGKSTLLRCLLGIFKVNSGSIKINGKNIREFSASELSRQIAYVPQASDSVFPLKVLDMVVMGRTPHLSFTSVPKVEDVEMAQRALDELGISRLSDCLFSQISGGERQMVLIARAIAQQAPILIMDEPTSSLDYGNQVLILKVIDKLVKKGYSILMASHFPNHAFLLCNKVLIMKNGKISAEGHPDVIVTEDRLSGLYGAGVRIAEVLSKAAEPVKVCIPMLSR